MTINEQVNNYAIHIGQYKRRIEEVDELFQQLNRGLDRQRELEKECQRILETFTDQNQSTTSPT